MAFQKFNPIAKYVFATAMSLLPLYAYAELGKLGEGLAILFLLQVFLVVNFIVSIITAIRVARKGVVGRRARMIFCIISNAVIAARACFLTQVNMKENSGDSGFIGVLFGIVVACIFFLAYFIKKLWDNK